MALHAARWALPRVLAGRCHRLLATSAACRGDGYQAVLNKGNINERLVSAEYAVRGRIPIRAAQLKKQMETDPGSLRFDNIVEANIGNPQILGQKPITFFRQVLVLLDYPDLLEADNLALTTQLFPADAIARAQRYLSSGVTTGAYSESAGIRVFRQEIANFIQARDGFPADPDDIMITSGASEGVGYVMEALASTDPATQVGVMIPIPQYPLYSATLTLTNSVPVEYFLDEANQWAISVDALESSLSAARAKGVDVRALCIIHPGNPTGQCMSKAQILDIVRFAHRNNLLLCADEVYQANCYLEEYPFVSFKQALREVPEAADELELISFHSVSKGVIGECGRRGGYMELVNVHPYGRAQILKRASINLCPPVQGQAMTALMCNPPSKGSPSHRLYEAETRAIFASLKRRALRLAEFFNSLEGITCVQSMGALYLFPQLRLPPKAIAAAKAQGIAPDEFYCMALLNATGVSTVPGSGFGQAEGTFHFRTTFLPPEEEIELIIQNIQVFHDGFMAQHR